MFVIFPNQSEKLKKIGRLTYELVAWPLSELFVRLVFSAFTAEMST